MNILIPTQPDDPVTVYITAANADEAERLALALVGERLAACANVLGAVSSYFWWNGAVQAEGEVAILAKSRAGRIDALIARVKALHSYSCPCIVALPIVAGNPDYLAWIVRETT